MWVLNMTKDGKIGLVIAVVVIGILIVDYFTGTDAVSNALQGVLNPDDSTSGSGASILSALSSFENVASQHNNPGGLCGSYTNGQCNGPATYGSLQDGTDAANALIQKIIANNPAITVEQFVAKWSGGTGTVLQNYVQHVADALGLDPDDPISDAGGDDDDSDDS